MKLNDLLSLPSILSALALSHAFASAHLYTEHLNLQPLPNHHLHADFVFTASTPLSAYDAHHYRYFPRSLAQILQHTHTAELHLRFALGRWDEESWGARPRRGTREGGTGVEIWAWLEGSNDREIEERWTGLVNSLSGLFCASLNFIDETKTIRPVSTFEAEGSHNDTSTLTLLHGMLPREVVCTENLTPFLKLLPCKAKAGISSLLDGHKLFDATWQSMSIDVRPVRPSTNVGQKNGETSLEIEQSISMALSIPRSMRDRHDPIPRPEPIENVECDQDMPWNSHDSCYPKLFDGEMAWNLSKIFGRPAKGRCTVTNNGGGTSHVSLGVPADRHVEMSSGGDSVITPLRIFELEPGKDFDLHLPQENLESKAILPTPPLYASRQITGHGQERGGIQTILRNPHPYAQRVFYLESLPWFLRPYMHTLTVTSGSIEKMFYTPAIDRKRGTHLELLLSIPAESTLELKYDFEKAILRYTEYPPDANRGFDVGAAIIRVLPANGTSQQDIGMQDQYLRTTSLLLPLPTPDFSMPYNVIILTSTVIALGFGSILNLLVRNFVFVEEVPKSPLVAKVQNLVQKVRERVSAIKAGRKGSAGETGRRQHVSQTDSDPVNGIHQASDTLLDTAGSRQRKVVTNH